MSSGRFPCLHGLVTNSQGRLPSIFDSNSVIFWGSFQILELQTGMSRRSNHGSTSLPLLLLFPGVANRANRANSQTAKPFSHHTNVMSILDAPFSRLFSYRTV